jgi:gas vesicle protein
MDNEVKSCGGIALGSFFLGMLSGAVVGGLAALLLTPKSGPDTREMISGRFNKVKDAFRSNTENMKEALK